MTISETTVRRRAREAGMLLRRSRRRDTRGLYVLVDDCAGNRRPGAQAPLSAFADGEGTDLHGIVAWLDVLDRRSR